MGFNSAFKGLSMLIFKPYIVVLPSVTNVKLTEQQLMFLSAARSGTCNFCWRDWLVREIKRLESCTDAVKGGSRKSLTAGFPCLASTDRRDFTWTGGRRLRSWCVHLGTKYGQLIAGDERTFWDVGTREVHRCRRCEERTFPLSG